MAVVIGKMRSAHDETKLPQWARDRIEQQRREITQLRNELWALKTGTEETAFFVENALDTKSGAVFYLPKYGRLQYHDRSLMSGKIELQATPYGLKVYALDGTLRVMPEAANVVTVTVHTHMAQWEEHQRERDYITV